MLHQLGSYVYLRINTSELNIILKPLYWLFHSRWRHTRINPETAQCFHGFGRLSHMVFMI